MRAQHNKSRQQIHGLDGRQQTEPATVTWFRQMAKSRSWSGNMHVIAHDKIVQGIATGPHASHHSDHTLGTSYTGLSFVLQFLSWREPYLPGDIEHTSRDKVIRGRHILKLTRPFALFS
jgi:hypothetical protein